MTPVSYQGKHSTITFEQRSDAGLKISIETKNLRIRMIEPGDFPHFVQLLGDKTTMQKFASGKVYSTEDVQKSFERSFKAQRENNPFGTLAVFSKKGEFVGLAALSPDKTPGVAEIAGVTSLRQLGYGTEAAIALIEDYALATIKAGYLIHGKPLYKIIATARPDNPGSTIILEKTLAMRFEKEEELYGTQRRFYSREVTILPSKL
jgi:RimJ/RimL family protein N-acetyltransferase